MVTKVYVSKERYETYNTPMGGEDIRYGQGSGKVTRWLACGSNNEPRPAPFCLSSRVILLEMGLVSACTHHRRPRLYEPIFYECEGGYV